MDRIGQNSLGFPLAGQQQRTRGYEAHFFTRPQLGAHLERWSKGVMEALGRRGGENVSDVFVEEYLRELWERSRASS